MIYGCANLCCLWMDGGSIMADYTASEGSVEGWSAQGLSVKDGLASWAWCSGVALVPQVQGMGIAALRSIVQLPENHAKVATCIMDVGDVDDATLQCFLFFVLP